MSGFKDTFTRTENNDKNLQYDDAAFFFFLTSIVLGSTIPLLISIIWSLCKRKIYLNPNIKKGSKSLGVDLAGNILKKQKIYYPIRTLFFKILLLVLILIFYQFIIKNTRDITKELKAFNPYDILEVAPESTDQEIKRAYRRLSILYHPDKNPNDPASAAKFLMITKAYECFSDEKSKLNCEKYGNPDGPGQFSVAIALPNFLLQKEYHVHILAVSFLILLIIIPSIFMWWYQESSKYDKDGVLSADKKIFSKFLNDKVRIENLPHLIASCHEFNQIFNVKKNQINDMLLLHENIITQFKGKFRIDIKYYKTHDLFLAWVTNTYIGKSFEIDLLKILSHAPTIIESFIIYAFDAAKQGKTKGYAFSLVNDAIEFSQLFYQGLWIGDHPYLQFSCFDEGYISRFRMMKKAPVPPMLALTRMNDKERRSLNFINEKDKQIFLDEVARLPHIDVAYKVYVEDEDEIILGDLLTIQVNLKRLNANIKNSGYLQTFKFPLVKKEHWYIIIVNPNTDDVLFYKKVNELNAFHEEKFHFRVDFAGRYNWLLLVLNDCYIDIDQEYEINFEVLAKKNTKKIVYHPEDEALDYEPNFYQQIVSSVANKGNNSDQELEEEEEEKEFPRNVNDNQDEEDEKDDEIPRNKQQIYQKNNNPQIILPCMPNNKIPKVLENVAEEDHANEDHESENDDDNLKKNEIEESDPVGKESEIDNKHKEEEEIHEQVQEQKKDHEVVDEKENIQNREQNEEKTQKNEYCEVEKNGSCEVEKNRSGEIEENGYGEVVQNQMLNTENLNGDCKSTKLEEELENKHEIRYENIEEIKENETKFNTNEKIIQEEENNPTLNDKVLICNEEFQRACIEHGDIHEKRNNIGNQGDNIQCENMPSNGEHLNMESETQKEDNIENEMGIKTGLDAVEILKSQNQNYTEKQISNDLECNQVENQSNPLEYKKEELDNRNVRQDITIPDDNQQKINGIIELNQMMSDMENGHQLGNQSSLKNPVDENKEIKDKDENLYSEMEKQEPKNDVNANNHMHENH